MLDMDEDGKIQIFELDQKYQDVYNIMQNQKQFANWKAFSMPPEEHLNELFRRYDVDDDNKLSRLDLKYLELTVGFFTKSVFGFCKFDLPNIMNFEGNNFNFN